MRPDNNDIDRIDRAALRLADIAIRHPWRVIAAALVLVGIALAGAPNLRFANNYRVFFSPDNPELVAFEHLQATYTKNDNILFVVKPEQGTVFTPRTTSAVEELTAEAWKIPYAIRVDSVTNFQHSWADGDELTVEDLIRDGAGLSVEQLANRRAIAQAEPLLDGLRRLHRCHGHRRQRHAAVPGGEPDRGAGGGGLRARPRRADRDQLPRDRGRPERCLDAQQRLCRSRAA